jgi:hypothetical protein
MISSNHHYFKEGKMIKRVERADDRLRSIEKPQLELLNKIHLEDNDLVVLVAGFEDRALGVIDRINSSACSGFKAVVIHYEPSLNENKIQKIHRLCSNLNAEIINLTYNRHDPAGAGEDLVDLINRLNIKGQIFLDVSAMSRLLIVQNLVALGKSERKFSDVRVLYSEAAKYPPTKKEVALKIKKHEKDTIYRTMFLSSGVFDVTIVPELTSIAMQGQPIRLIAFPSFNPDQLASLRGEMQPSYFSFIHGIPHLSKNSWRPEAIKLLNHIAKILNSEARDNSTFYYQETLDYLLEIYNLYSDMERIVIAPIGSKMQTVAVGIFRSFMNDVQIVYPTPKKFPSPHNYTMGVKDIYSLALDSFNI